MKEEEGGEWRIHYSELRFQTHFETCIFIIHTNMAENIEISQERIFQNIDIDGQVLLTHWKQ